MEAVFSFSATVVVCLMVGALVIWLDESYPVEKKWHIVVCLIGITIPTSWIAIGLKGLKEGNGYPAEMSQLPAGICSVEASVQAPNKKWVVLVNGRWFELDKQPPPQFAVFDGKIREVK